MRFRALSASALAALALAGTLAGCNKSGGSTGEFLKTKSGLEYQLFRKDADGDWQTLLLADVTKADTAKQLRAGKVLLMEQVALNGKDSVLSNTYDTGMPQPYMMNPAQPTTLLDEPMRMLAAGDSGVFRVPSDSVFKKMPPEARPKFIPKGSFVKLCIKANEVLPMAAAQTRMQELQTRAETRQGGKDATVLAKYVADHLPLRDAVKTPTGVYVLITQQGTGPKPEPGQIVSLSYRGTLLDGKEFDSSLRDGKQTPFEYPFGQGKVIPGWDQGVSMLSKGAKATILVPSTLAYGLRGAPPRIPANASLRFDLELNDIKPAPAAQATPQMPPMSEMPGAGQAR